MRDKILPQFQRAAGTKLHRELLTWQKTNIFLRIPNQHRERALTPACRKPGPNRQSGDDYE
jgi:hypothetical protein